MSLPERLGRLRRIGRLGVGGFATVWLYYDEELQSDVAVKALADNWSQRIDVRERFLEEARILRRADSDHVVRVYDIGEEDGTPYFVMTYADRGSMAGLVDGDEPICHDQVVDLITQAGEGIAVLHDQGILHRDVKPPNLLLRTEGDKVRLMVADLGVAKAAAHASGLTQVVGTPAYMAPEQTSGMGIDERADVHALGAVAYHLLTGQQVRTGGFASLSDPQLPEAPSAYADVPADLCAVVMRAIAIDPEDRYPSVREFTAALQEAHQPSQPPDNQHSAKPTPRASKSTIPSLVLLCLVVLILAAAIGYGLTTLLI